MKQRVLQAVTSDAQLIIPANASDTRLCCEQCKFDGKAGKRNGRKLDMIQYSVCAVWFHTECVDIKKDTPVGVWPCLACRQIPTKISDIAAALGSMDQLVASVRAMSEQLFASERHVAIYPCPDGDRRVRVGDRRGQGEGEHGGGCGVTTGSVTR